METANAAFLVVVVLSVATSATVAADFGSEINTVGNVVPLLQEEVSVETPPVTVEDGELRVTTTVRNPTGVEFRITGAAFGLRNGTANVVVQGPARSGGSTTVPADGEVTLDWRVPLGPDERTAASDVLAAGDATLTGRFGAVVNGEEVTLRLEPRPAGEA